MAANTTREQPRQGAVAATDTAAREPEPRPAKRGRDLGVWLAAAGYLLMAVALTWPMVFHLGSYVYGGGGDAWGGMAMWREMVGHNPFLPGTISDFAAPDGLTVSYALHVATWPSTLMLWTLTSLFGEVAAVNLFTLSAYVLSGTAMFLFARRLTGRADVAFVAGFAFAFSPFAATKGAGHWQFAHGWPLVLIAWQMLRFVERPSLRMGVVTGLIVSFAISFTPYYVLFGGVMLATFFIVGAVLAFRGGRFRAYVAPVVVVLAIVGATLGFYTAVGSTDENAPIREEGTAEQVWSGKPLQYLIPHDGNVFLGEWATDFRRARGLGAGGETNVYVGISILLLAAVGTWMLFGRVRRRQVSAALLALPLLVLAAALFSMPASVSVLGTEVKTLVGYAYDVTKAWRVYIRFVDVAMIGLVLLAALMLAWTTARLRPPLRAAAVAAAFAVIFFDLSPIPFRQTAHPVPAPAVYDRVADLPPGLVAEYPMEPGIIPSYEPLLFQELHGHPLVNGYAIDSIEEERALWLSDLRAPHAVRGLATLGVRYVIITEGANIDGRPWMPEQRIAGLEPLFDGDGRHVFRLADDVEPTPYLAVWDKDVHGEVSAPPVRWVADDRAELDIRAACDRCRARVVLEVTTYGKPREVRISAKGRSATARTTSEQPARLVLDVPEFERGTRIQFEASPGPQPVGGGDPRVIGAGILSTSIEIQPLP